MSNKTAAHRVEAEYNNIAIENAWVLVYSKIGRLSQAYPYTVTEAKKPENKHLNRYRDVNPYDHSRVKLNRCDNDYINANFVKMERANRSYILTQGPLSLTVDHFWLMVMEQDSRAIVMLNKIYETREMKCHWYWPKGNGPEHQLELESVKLTIEQLYEEDNLYYLTRYFKVTDKVTYESREVVQFHYTTWPDFGVPSSPVAFLDFLKEVRESGALDPEVGPLVVHCSAGIGRSGTFCLVDSCLVIIEKEGPNSLQVQDILLELRKHRMGLIQTPDQLRFSYEAIIEGTQRLYPTWLAYNMTPECEENYVPHPDLEKTLSTDCDVDDYEPCSDLDKTLEPDYGDDDSDVPPPPPPRIGSLDLDPTFGPLPAVPNRAKKPCKVPEIDEGSSSDKSRQSVERDSMSSASSVADEENICLIENFTQASGGESLRRRRNIDLAERVAAMKKRAHDAEKRNTFKRSLYKPILAFGFIFAGLIIYAYARH